MPVDVRASRQLELCPLPAPETVRHCRDAGLSCERDERGQDGHGGGQHGAEADGEAVFQFAQIRLGGHALIDDFRHEPGLGFGLLPREACGFKAFRVFKRVEDDGCHAGLSFFGTMAQPRGIVEHIFRERRRQ